MKDFLVKLSRNSKIMVPIVAVLALGIYSGSYVIRHRDTVAKQEEQTQQEDQTRKAADNLSSVDTAQKEDTSSQDSSSDKTAQDDSTDTKVAPDVEKVSMTVNVSVLDKSVVVVANFGSSNPGTCKVQLLQAGNLLDTKSGSASNGQCSVTLDKPNVSGEIKVQVIYASDDLTAKAVEDKDFKI